MDCFAVFTKAQELCNKSPFFLHQAYAFLKAKYIFCAALKIFFTQRNNLL